MLDCPPGLSQSPSVNTRSIALILILTTLVSRLAGEETPEVQVEELLRTTRTWDGALLPPYPDAQPEITILKITIAPGARLPWHTHPVINTGILLEGSLVVTAEDGSQYAMKPWDTISELVDTPHFGENPGDEPAVILVIYSGALGLPLTVLMEDSGEPEACCASH